MFGRILCANDGSERAYRALTLAVAMAKAQQRARTLAGENHIALRIHLMTGHAVRDIVRLATEIKADLLVIGATGHSQFYERMLGSRADRLVHLAPCPVLVVR